MTPDFVRSAYWLATLHGMNVNYTWFWAREKDGAIRKDLMNYRGPDNAMNNAYAAKCGSAAKGGKRSCKKQ